ncbi:MAG: disulfide bond formation protein B [Burkholderiaceae bacterium]|jgi:disulfide bond formation protein DsbB|nr:disulfide bond formation protein B [Burkholderiaceae bacterium]
MNKFGYYIENKLNSRFFLGGIALLSSLFLLFAYYLQHGQDILPCTLCVLQRYAFLALVVFCAPGYFTRFTRLAALPGVLTAAGGMLMAGRQVWIAGNPSTQCGRDPLQEWVNSRPPAKWFPDFFEAQGFCQDGGETIVGLTLPQWSLAWFSLFALILLFVVLRRNARQ